VGAAWLAELSLGWGIVGTGILLLGLQALRALLHAKVDVFWIVVAMALVVGGFWELWDVAIPLAPLVLIAVGIGLLIWRQILHNQRFFAAPIATKLCRWRVRQGIL
jgi:hypothetical protein